MLASLVFLLEYRGNLLLNDPNSKWSNWVLQYNSVTKGAPGERRNSGLHKREISTSWTKGIRKRISHQKNKKQKKTNQENSAVNIWLIIGYLEQETKQISLLKKNTWNILIDICFLEFWISFNAIQKEWTNLRTDQRRVLPENFPKTILLKASGSTKLSSKRHVGKKEGLRGRGERRLENMRPQRRVAAWVSPCFLPRLSGVRALISISVLSKSGTGWANTRYV